jgi:hypothetical protein
MTYNEDDNGGYGHELDGLLKMVDYWFNSFDFRKEMFIVPLDKSLIKFTIKFITNYYRIILSFVILSCFSTYRSYSLLNGIDNYK